jgi:hypothetical protein
MLTPDELSLLRLYKAQGYQTVTLEGQRDRLHFQSMRDISVINNFGHRETAVAKNGYCAIRVDQFKGLEKFRTYKLGDLLNG